MHKVRCLKCEREIGVAGPDDFTPWEMPSRAVMFHDGGNYGSALYDSACDGVTVHLLVCDDCLTKHRDLIRVDEPTREWKAERVAQRAEALGAFANSVLRGERK